MNEIIVRDNHDAYVFDIKDSSLKNLRNFVKRAIPDGDFSGTLPGKPVAIDYFENEGRNTKIVWETPTGDYLLKYKRMSPTAFSYKTPDVLRHSMPDAVAYFTVTDPLYSVAAFDALLTKLFGVNRDDLLFSAQPYVQGADGSNTDAFESYYGLVTEQYRGLSLNQPKNYQDFIRQFDQKVCLHHMMTITVHAKEDSLAYMGRSNILIARAYAPVDLGKVTIDKLNNGPYGLSLYQSVKEKLIDTGMMTLEEYKQSAAKETTSPYTATAPNQRGQIDYAHHTVADNEKVLLGHSVSTLSNNGQYRQSFAGNLAKWIPLTRETTGVITVVHDAEKGLYRHITVQFDLLDVNAIDEQYKTVDLDVDLLMKDYQVSYNSNMRETQMWLAEQMPLFSTFVGQMLVTKPNGELLLTMGQLREHLKVSNDIVLDADSEYISVGAKLCKGKVLIRFNKEPNDIRLNGYITANN